MASVFLTSNESFDIYSGQHKIYGASGSSINLLNSTPRVTLDANISGVTLSNNQSAYQYKVNGTSVSFADTNGNVIVEFSGLNDTVGITFGDGTQSSLVLTGLNKATIGGQSVSSSGFADLGVVANTGTLLTQAQAMSNTVSGYGTVPKTGDSPAVESGEYWTNSTVTYSYSTTQPADYTGNYAVTGFMELPTGARTAVKASFDDISTFAAVTFSEVVSNGDIRLNAVTQSGNTDGYAYYPGSGIGGDVFLNNQYTTTAHYASGGSPFFTVVHEIGHAMGLDHSFEGSATLPAAEENTLHSVMSYTNVNNYSLDFTFSGNSINSSYVSDHNNTGYAYYDVIALQAAYGVNTTYNNTDTIYTANFATTVQEVIWDAGGTDTIDASSATGVCTVDLRESQFSSIDVHTASDQAASKITEMGITSSNFVAFINEQYANAYSQSSLFTGENNLVIGKGVWIENVSTGSANDTVQDNAVNNIIITGAGNDTILLTSGGFDTVDGGTGTDKVQFNVASSAATVEQQPDGSYIVLGSNFSAQLTGVETLQFTDTTTTLA